MYLIKTMNKISPVGLAEFPHDIYEVASQFAEPDAILLRSDDLHGVEFPASVKAIARAGAGVNNIPLDYCADRGIVVFNTPGGNANAVKELTIASMLLSSRKLTEGMAWAKTIQDKADEVPDLAEKEKNRFVGPEILGKTLGVVGLGAVGALVANDAIALGMHVIGYDPYISVDAAWSLSQLVQRADSLEGLLAKADFVTLHIPLEDSTRGIIGAEKIRLMKKGSRLINLARGGLVNEADVIAALDSERLSYYITDFPSAELLACEKAICFPHLGASTPEAEDVCAKMAVQQLMAFLETGAIINSVNYPRCRMEQRAPYRLTVSHRNIPNMIGQVTTMLAKEHINIIDMINQSRGNYSYNIIDTEQEIPTQTLDEIIEVDGIIKVRSL